MIFETVEYGKFLKCLKLEILGIFKMPNGEFSKLQIFGIFKILNFANCKFLEFSKFQIFRIFKIDNFWNF